MSAHPNLISSLHWVQGELAESLTRIRTLVEQHMETPANQLPLQQAVVELHQVRGTAAMIQCAGVAALAEEMKLAVQDLLQGRIAEAEPAYAALLSASVQLGDYIDVIATGLDDCALVFQPAINELRVARGRGVLSEAELFAEQVAGIAGAVTLPPSETRAPGAAQALAKKFLLVFQQSLLAWLKNQDVQLALGRMGKVAEQIAAAATTVPVYQLWRIAAALVEAQLTRGLQETPELKRLFGRAGTLLKTLAEQGEAAAAEASGTLPYQLLYHVGRSQSQGPRVSALRALHQLSRLLPAPATLDALRQKIRGPNTQLLTRLSEEIRNDLAQVKDNIDLVVRAGEKAPADLQATVQKLQRMADTLNMLGLSQLQRVIQNQAQRLGGIQPQQRAANDPVWLEVATALLRVEHSLDEALFRQLRRRGESSQAELEGGIPQVDLREGREALQRELLVDLAKLKGAVDPFFKSGDAAALGDAGRIIADVQSALRIMRSERAAELTGQLGVFMRSRNFALIRERPEQIERFADAIACIEYYLESLQKREPATERIVDDLARYVEALDIPAGDVPVHDTTAFQAVPVAAAPTPAAAGPALEPQVDPEIRAVFVDEAREVLQTLQQRVPEVKRDAGNKEALADVRRAFHTLKGSGRMVGARILGDFGWAIEHLLNRCLEGTVPLSPPVMQVVDDAVALLPGLIDAFSAGQPADAAVAELIERAHRQAKGDADKVDGEIVQTFCADARQRLDAIQTWIGQQDRDRPEFRLDETLNRSFHTLRGSAALVHAEAIAQLTGALEAYLDALREADLKLPAAGFALMVEAAAELRTWVERVAGRDPTEPDAKPWLRRIEGLQADVPQSSVQAAADRKLADVFANDAFTRLEEAERLARDWARSPQNIDAPKALRHLFQTVHGDAMTARCEGLGHVAQVLERRLAAFTDGATPPGESFYREFAAIVEGMYRQLDNFRDAKPVGDGSDLVARVEALGPAMAAPPSDEAPQPDEALPAIEVTEEVAAEAVEEEILEMPPVEPMETATDPELVALFQAEAEELLENIDRQFDAWEREPDSTGPLGELSRALHTFKGSARRANVPAFVDLSHRVESLLTLVAQGRVRRDATLFARLHNVVDGLHGLLDDLRRGGSPDAAALIAELEGVGPAPEPAAAPPAVTARPPAFEPPPRPETPQAEATSGFDAELADIFRGEAAELLETIEASLAAWQNDRTDDAALHELQRALHTFKGGARMAGLMVMGSAAHEMESRVEKMERGQIATDSAAFAQLHSELEQLHRLHDRLARGEGAALMEEAPPAAPAPDGSVEPTVETYDLPAREEAASEPAEAAEPAVPAVPAGALARAGWDPQLFWRPVADADSLAAMRRETARVAVDQLDKMLNEAGEISIYRSRLEQHNSALQFQLQEMVETIRRVREQLRALDIETESQIAARGFSRELDKDKHAEFDPLEMDRYSRMQELSRALSESVGDLAALHATMDGQLSEANTLLLQQGRVNTEVQQGLMGTLMVPFSRQVQRLQRVVRQTASDAGKQADVSFEGIEQEMDRKVLERMVAPLEHLLRNAVVHGIEDPASRAAAGKPATGQIRVSLRREGTQLAIELADDGRGLDYDAIRRTAVERGIMAAGAALTDEQVAMFIFEPGFSTAREVTQAAGRGVGMDVVASEVKQLGGTLELASQPGRGTRFLVRLPLTLALSQALLVGAGTETYAIPLPTVESIVRLPKAQLAEYVREDGPPFSYGGHEYRVRALREFLDAPAPQAEDEGRTVPAVLVRLGESLGGGERRAAVVVDGLYGNREIVSKAVGPQISSVQGISGATILPDGRVVLMLDLPALLADRARRTAVVEAAQAETAPAPLADERPLVMVVDDSITIRRVTERLLDKHGFRVTTAKDGLDAIAMLQTERPAVVLLDIEMPRADGFEVATFVRNHAELKDLPIIMITSRSGEKHRERARQIGVNQYLIKPYQEDQLIAEVRTQMRAAGVLQ